MVESATQNIVTKQGLTRALDVKDLPLKSFKTPHPLLNKIFSHQGGPILEQVYFVTGSSGAGKTTFLTQLQCEMKDLKSAQYNRESTAGKIRSRNTNMDFHDNVFLDDEKSIPSFDDFLELTKQEGMDFIIIDSLQTAAADLEGSKLEREVEAIRKSVKWAKDTGGTVFIIGMVTKEEGFAGAQEIMQLVDAHLHLTFDKSSGERYMEFQQKNRDGEVYNRIYYSFREDGKGIKFHSPEEWMMKNNKYSLSEVVQNTIQSYLDGWKTHKNYGEFKQELGAKHDGLLKQEFENQIQYQCALLMLINTGIEKHFNS